MEAHVLFQIFAGLITVIYALTLRKPIEMLTKELHANSQTISKLITKIEVAAERMENMEKEFTSRMSELATIQREHSKKLDAHNERFHEIANDLSHISGLAKMKGWDIRPARTNKRKE